MGLTTKSRAHLVRMLAVLPAAEWEGAAVAAGFIVDPEILARPREPARTERDDRVEPPPPPGPRASPRPYVPTELPDLPFWRVTAQSVLPTDPTADETPPWLAETRPWAELPESDRRLPPPRQSLLVPPPRQARFLRRQLAAQRGAGPLDMAQLCGLLAQRRLPRRLPRLPRTRWPARVHLLIDHSQPLRPYWDDFWQVEEHLRRTLGDRLQTWLTRSSDPADVIRSPAGEPGALPIGDGALIVLGDAGMYGQGSFRKERWARFGQRCLRKGVRALLIAPVPLRLADAHLGELFRLVLWDRGAPLQPLRHHAAPQPGERSAVSPAINPGSLDLLASLAHASRVEPPLLRALRFELSERGTDIGSEYEVWHHPTVRANILACALSPEGRGAARAAFAQLPATVQRRVAAVREDGNRHQSPLIRAEEVLAEGGLASVAARRRSEAVVRRLAATLHRGADTAPGELAAYVDHLGLRRPELLARSAELATAWAVANREALRAGTVDALPPGLKLETLRWLVGTDGTPPVFLGQEGDRLGVYPQASAQPLCHLADLAPGAELWQIEPDQGDEASQEGEPGVQALRLGEGLAVAVERRYRVTIGRRQLELEAVRRPAWAVGIGHCAEGLFVERDEGSRAFWVPQGPIAVAGLGGPAQQSAVQPDTFALPHGFWWHEDEYRPFLAVGRVLNPPTWAGRHGIDSYGCWAEFEVKGVIQRLRWIPPGEFLMGSPGEEAGRYKEEGEFAETQHPVVLTRGFWLADTACMQALWQAVLGENSSQFRGAELPVENVSWNDVVERFLPALERLVPDLVPALPTEAQWEYACRAGTTTPFWFGENITTDQTNYAGKFVDVGGVRLKVRNRTVAVKALPANGWGLYQMHGNVWEWCADWVGEYPKDEVVDPQGPRGGRERVLRGGSWCNFGRLCRSANRYGFGPGVRNDFYGFRLARGLPGQAAGSAGGAGEAAGGGAPAAKPDSPAPRRQAEARRVEKARTKR